LAVAEQAHFGHTWKRLELVLHVSLCVVGDLERQMLVAEEGEMEDRLGVGLDLLDDRLVDLIRKAAAHAPDPIAHIRRGIIGVAVELEPHGDLARFLPADRGDEVDAFDARQRILEHLRDLGLDDGRAGAGIIGLHGDHRRVDRRIFSHA